MKKIVKYCGLAAMLAGAALYFSSCGEGPTEPEYDGVWEVVPTPKCLAGVRDICFVTPNDGWAVAGHQIWHYEGSGWKLFKDLRPANPRYDYGLTQVWFNGPNDGWFAGVEARSQSDYSSKMWHYEGSSFKEMSIPDVRHIYKLWFNAPDDGWAFGGDYALRYDGEKWYKTEFPTLHWSDCFFWNSNDGWAVSGFHNIWKWDGTKWTVEYDVHNWLHCVGFAAPDNGWAMGEWREYSGEAPIYRFDGTKWGRYKWPYRQSVFFEDVEFLRPDYGWAVGYHTFFWDGEKWTRYDIPRTEGCGFDYPLSLECVSEAEVWVGTNDGRILRFKGFRHF